MKYESLSIDEFIEYMRDEIEYFKDGFEQYELVKTIDEYNGIAQVFRSFYAKDNENQEVRGMSSYQLVRFDDRWWISSVLWTNDTNGVQIPKEYMRE